jgi:predicted AAA+ superfamily ATPase
LKNTKFAADLRSQGIPAGREVLYEILDHLEDAFLLHALPVATDSEKRKQVNPRKVCPIDHDPTTAFVRSQKANTGHALEVSVRNELLRCGAEVAYVRTRSGYEVNFLCHGADGGEPLVQVRADPGDVKTLAREVRALKRRQ